MTGESDLPPDLVLSVTRFDHSLGSSRVVRAGARETPAEGEAECAGGCG